MHFNLNRVLIYLGNLCLCYFQVSMAIRFHTSHFKCHNYFEILTFFYPCKCVFSSTFRDEQWSRRSQSKGSPHRAGGKGPQNPFSQTPSSSSSNQPPTKPQCQPQVPSPVYFPLQRFLPRPPIPHKLSPSPRGFEKTSASSSYVNLLLLPFQPHITSK